MVSVLGIVIVVAYQLYKRKRTNEEKDYSPDRKKMNDLRELENLISATKSQQQGIGGRDWESRSIPSRRNPRMGMETPIDDLLEDEPRQRSRKSAFKPIGNLISLADEEEDSY